MQETKYEVLIENYYVVLFMYLQLFFSKVFQPDFVRYPVEEVIIKKLTGALVVSYVFVVCYGLVITLFVSGSLVLCTV